MSLLLILAGGVGPQQVSPVGIASANALGQPALTLTVASSGSASAEAHGTASVQVGVTPGEIASAEAFGAPSAEARTDAVAIASAEALGAPSVSTALDIIVFGIASAEVFGEPTVLLAAEGGARRWRADMDEPALTTRIGAVSIASACAFGLPTLEWHRTRRVREEELFTRSLQ